MVLYSSRVLITIFFGLVFFAFRSWDNQIKIRFYYFLCRHIWLFNISFKIDCWCGCLMVNVFVPETNINNKYTSDTVAKITLSREFRIYLHNFRYRDTSQDIFRKNFLFCDEIFRNIYW